MTATQNIQEQILIRIYALIDPETEDLFYVGRTATTLNIRLHGHISKSKISDSKKSLRIRSILSKGCRPKIALLDEQNCFSLVEIRDLEQYWIDKISLEYTLCNEKNSNHGAIPGHSKIQWADSQLELLGKISDERLAQRMGISKTSVVLKRQELGIPAFIPRKEWDEEEIALLGSMPDPYLADKLGVTLGRVLNKRKSLGIDSFRKKVSPKIADSTLPMIGTMPDKRLAERVGASTSFVRNKRISLGIPASRAFSRQAQKWDESNLALLGKMPDTELALFMGVSRSTVRNKRISLGIPASPPLSKEWDESSLALLGKISDRKLALLMGVCHATVGEKRRHLCIPPCS